MKLWIWLLEQEMVGGYEYYDSAIVAAATEKEARQIEVGGTFGVKHGTWPASEHVTAQLIGEAAKGIKPGVILGSFNAG